MKEKVLLGMSGGVDSTVAAILLQEQGYKVEGVYMIMHDLQRLNDENIKKAKKVANYLNIKLHILNIKDTFKSEVYDYFIKSYKEGLTPNPCVICNRKIKFGKMIDFANSLNIKYIATGHYARVKDGFIYQGLDKSKDQSYFLAEVKKDIIKRVIFPLGEWLKDDVKKYATNIELLKNIATQKESSEICFVENSYIDILKNHFNPNKEGVVKNIKGEEVGNHKGFMHYTIGKRRGFFVKGAHEPHYVLDIDAKNNILIVGKKDDLAKKDIIISNINLFIDSVDFEATIKVRYRSSGIKGSIKLDNNIGLINLKEPAYGIAKGQFAVFYNEEKLLGGGEIIDVI